MPSESQRAACTAPVFLPDTGALRRVKVRSLFSSLLLLALAGCGSGYAPATVDSIQPLPQTGKTFTSVTHFGDSITCGYYASPNDGSGFVWSNEGYAGLLDKAFGLPAQNFCRGGDQAADMVRLWISPNVTPQVGGHQLYTAMIGTNDANACGPSDGCLSNYRNTLAASLAWLALPVSDRISSNAIIASPGQWTTAADNSYTTTDTGASLQFKAHQSVANRSLYIAYHAWDLPAGVAGSAAVAIDGKQVTVLTAWPSGGRAIATQNGTGDTIFLQPIPLGATGDHTVVLTTTSVGGIFAMHWAGVISGNYVSLDGAPRVLLGKVPNTTSGNLNTTIALYETAITDVVGGLTADGLDIKIAPTDAVLGSSLDFADVAHPNASGHIKLAAAFSGAL